MTRMRALRSLLSHRTLSLAALVLALGFSGAERAHAQQLGEGMNRSGIVGIQNDTERTLFSGLICTCGCPREALSTCTCEFAAARREELRSELVSGRSVADIQASYAKRYGPQALALPPNEGAHRLVWIVPLVALVASAAFVGSRLRRWSAKRRDPAPSSPLPSSAKAAPRDELDDQLDQELEDLDDR